MSVDLDKLEAVFLAAPAGPYLPAGDPRRPYGLSVRTPGGSQYQIGNDGSIPSSLVSYLLAIHDATPDVIAEIRRLQAENQRLRNQVSKLKGSKANAPS